MKKKKNIQAQQTEVVTAKAALNSTLERMNTLKKEIGAIVSEIFSKQTRSNEMTQQAYHAALDKDLIQAGIKYRGDSIRVTESHKGLLDTRATLSEKDIQELNHDNEMIGKEIISLATFAKTVMQENQNQNSKSIPMPSG